MMIVPRVIDYLTISAITAVPTVGDEKSLGGVVQAVCGAKVTREDFVSVNVVSELRMVFVISSEINAMAMRYKR
jgi:hypothetical protein